MASAASASGPKSSQYSRLSSRAALESWWLETPRKLRRYSTFLSAAWSDGIYLTAWPLFQRDQRA